MKLRYITLAFLSIYVSVACAQGKFLSHLEHRIAAGFNFGATAPTSLPGEIRKINAYWVQFSPRLGYEVTYRIPNSSVGVGTGILLDYKGMGTKATVKSMYTLVDLKTDDGVVTKEGNFTGRNKTEVKSAYATIPLFVSFKSSDRWDFRLGGYASYLFSGRFSGIVHDGYLRDGSPVGDKWEIPEADFDFGSEMKNFDFGLMGGVNYALNDRFGLAGDLTWGLTPIFPSSFRGMEFKMYNIYLVLGITYKL